MSCDGNRQEDKLASQHERQQGCTSLTATLTASRLATRGCTATIPGVLRRAMAHWGLMLAKALPTRCMTPGLDRLANCVHIRRPQAYPLGTINLVGCSWNCERA